jgi:hypothetical protein
LRPQRPHTAIPCNGAWPSRTASAGLVRARAGVAGDPLAVGVKRGLVDEAGVVLPDQDSPVCLGQATDPLSRLTVLHMLFYGLLLIRLYEARRLIMARGEVSRDRRIHQRQLDDWCGRSRGCLHPTAGRQESRGAVVLRLAPSHRPLLKIGEPTLRGLLHDYRNFPAHMAIREGDRRLSLEYEWVTATLAEEAWGAQPWTPEFVQHLETFSQQTTAIATAWVMISNVLVMSTRGGAASPWSASSRIPRA